MLCNYVAQGTIEEQLYPDPVFPVKVPIKNRVKNKIDDSKKFSILKKGIGIKGEKITETS